MQTIYIERAIELYCRCFVLLDQQVHCISLCLKSGLQPKRGYYNHDVTTYIDIAASIKCGYRTQKTDGNFLFSFFFKYFIYQDILLFYMLHYHLVSIIKNMLKRHHSRGISFKNTFVKYLSLIVIHQPTLFNLFLCVPLSVLF